MQTPSRGVGSAFFCAIGNARLSTYLKTSSRMTAAENRRTRCFDMDAITKQKRRTSQALERTYPDLHDHVRTLEEAGQLITVDRPINKDTEMHPLVRWQFRVGIEEKDRKAFLFTN